MALYCVEKFERTDSGVEKIVYWRQDKHIHNTSFINTIERKLGVNYGGIWRVRVNSFRSNQPEPQSKNSVNYNGL